MRRFGLGVVAAATLLACDTADDAGEAVSTAKALMKAAQQAEEIGKSADQAAQAAEERALAEAPEGASEQEKAQLAGHARAVAALTAMGKAGGGGQVVNWRKLAPFLGDSIGDFKAEADVKGATNKAGGFKVSTVSRKYKSGSVRLSLKITDTSMNPMLKAPFAMAGMIEEDSSEGYKKGTKVAGQPGFVEWRQGSKRSEATILAGERFIVEAKVRGTDRDGAAVEALKGLDLAGLAKLESEQPAEPGQASDG